MLFDGLIIRKTSPSTDDDFHTLTAITTIRVNDEFLIYDPVIAAYRKILWEDVVKLIASPTDGNLIQMDADGRPEDSGIAATDVASALVAGVHSPFLVGTKTVDEAAISDNYVLSYDSASGKLIYVAPAAGGGGGDVYGPAANADGYIPSWVGVNSKTLGAGFSVQTSVRPTAIAVDTALATEQAVRELVDSIRFRNHAWNSSFEWMIGTAACMGWSQLSTATIVQDVGVRDGYGGAKAIKITSAGAAKEGVSQTLKDLKASTVYTVRVWAKVTAGDTAKAFTTGASSQLSITSTSTTGEYITGTFTTDATPADVVLKLGSDTSGDIVWFDCLTITEGSEVPYVYFKDKEWDAPKQIAFGKGDGSAVVAIGAMPGVIKALDAYQIVGYDLRTDISATITIDVWKKAGVEPTNTDTLGTTKVTMTGVAVTGVPDWTVTEITKGDQIRAEIEANNNAKEVDFVLIVRRR